MERTREGGERGGLTRAEAASMHSFQTATSLAEWEKETQKKMREGDRIGQSYALRRWEESRSLLLEGKSASGDATSYTHAPRITGGGQGEVDDFSQNGSREEEEGRYLRNIRLNRCRLNSKTWTALYREEKRKRRRGLMNAIDMFARFSRHQGGERRGQTGPSAGAGRKSPGCGMYNKRKKLGR